MNGIQGVTESSLKHNPSTKNITGKFSIANQTIELNIIINSMTMGHYA